MDLDRIMNRTFRLMAKSLKQRKKEKDRQISRKEIADYKKATTDMITRIYDRKEADTDRQHELDKQALVNRGEFDRQGLANRGLVDQTQLEETGLDRRHGRKFEYKRSMPIFKEFKTKTSNGMNETETTDYRNYNTPEGLANKRYGGEAGPEDIKYLSSSTNVGKSEPENQRRLPIDPKAPLEALPQGTGYLQTEGGRTLEVRGNNIREISNEAMPTRTHQLTNPASSTSAPTDNGQPGIPRMLQSAHTPGKRQYKHKYGSIFSGAKGQSLLNENGQQPKAFGGSFIHRDLGHAMGIDKAHNMATGFNRTLPMGRNLSNRAGNAMIERGIKPAAKWATEEHKAPYQRGIY